MIFNRNQNRSQPNKQPRRRMVFPSPKPADNQRPQAQVQANSGYVIEPGAQPAKDSKGISASINVRPQVLIAVLLAIVLFVATSMMPSPGAAQLRADMPGLLQEYEEYLKGKNPNDRSNRLAEVQHRLEDLALYDSLGDKQNAKTVLEELLLMDSDTRSPLYKYGVKLLQNFND